MLFLNVRGAVSRVGEAAIAEAEMETCRNSRAASMSAPGHQRSATLRDFRRLGEGAARPSQTPQKRKRRFGESTVTSHGRFPSARAHQKGKSAVYGRLDEAAERNPSRHH